MRMRAENQKTSSKDTDMNGRPDDQEDKELGETVESELLRSIQRLGSP